MIGELARPVKEILNREEKTHKKVHHLIPTNVTFLRLKNLQIIVLFVFP